MEPYRIASESLRFGDVEFIPLITGALKDPAVEIMLHLGEGNVASAWISGDEWAEALLCPVSKDAVTSLAVSLCKRAGYRVQRKKLGVWHDTWETI
jgi:hypothetical protein